MLQPAPVSRPAISPWEMLMTALGEPNLSPEMVAREAEARVALGHLPGRPGGSYSSALEAAVDHRRWLLEMDVKSTASVHAAALDDVDGAFGDRAAADAAKLALDDARRREYVVATSAPIARRIALAWELRDAERELAALTPDAPRKVYAEAEVAQTGLRAWRTPNDGPSAADELHKFEVREIAKARALDNHATRYSLAFGAVQSVRSRIDRWNDEFPRLAAAFESRA